jgi:hypothetical protein
MPAPTYTYNIKMWVPHTVTYAAAATADKITMKAPEFNDTYAFGRVQTILRTRNGGVVSYDYGIQEIGTIDLAFKEVHVDQWNALITFFNRPTVNWGLTTIALETQEGTLYKVRLKTPMINGKIDSYITHDPACAAQRPLWNFDLSFYDVTSNP